jgi:hypothetical protein
MEQDTALPTATEAEAGASQAVEQVTEQAAQTEQTDAQAEKKEGEGEGQPKKEKTPEEREIARLRRRVDNLTKRLYQGGERQQPNEGLQREPINDTNRQAQADSESLLLSRAELAEMVRREAEKLAPTIKQQADEIERRTTVLEGLAKTWGQEKFDALASDLDDALGGLADRSGKPKPATDAIFEADDPSALIEYLADPDNAAEAAAIARMSPVQAGRAVAKLETKLATTKAAAKPKPSNAPAPLEAVRGGGSTSTAPNPSDTKAWIRWRNAQERAGA